MKEIIKFETWKTGKHVVARNEKGHFVRYRKLKNSNIKNKEEAIKIFKETGTFYKDRVATKSKIIKVPDLISRTRIGKNTYLLRSKDKIKNQTHYQYVATMYWGDKKKKTVGYSDIRGSKKQALDRAIAGAVMANIIKYEYKISIDDKIGFAYNIAGTVRVYFEYTVEVATYAFSK